MNVFERSFECMYMILRAKFISPTYNLTYVSTNMLHKHVKV